MSWGAIALGTATAVSVGSKAYAYNKAKGARSNLEGFELPVYEEDKDYNDSQAILKLLGENILEGDIPDFYSDIGKRGSDSFLDYLNLSNSKISDAVLDSSAATGRRGGAVQSQIAELVGENTTKLGYQDYLTALQGKEYLLNTGTSLTSDVRAAGQKREGMKNQFNFNVAGMDLDYRQAMDEADARLGAAEAEALSALVDAGIGGLTGFAGAPSGGKMTGTFEGILGYSDILNNTKTALPNVVGGDTNKKIKLGGISGKYDGTELLELLKNY